MKMLVARVPGPPGDAHCAGLAVQGGFNMLSQLNDQFVSPNPDAIPSPASPVQAR